MVFLSVLAILLYSIPQTSCLSLRFLQIFNIFVDIVQSLWYNRSVMNITYKNNNIILSELKDFALVDVFDCGQCFRWNKLEDGSYIGVAKNKALKISQDGESLILHNTSPEDFEFSIEVIKLSADFSPILSRAAISSFLR